MKKSTVIFLGMFILFGCGSKQDANEKNFGQAISQYLEKNGHLCVARGRWPDASKEYELGYSFWGEDKEMAVLEKAGLVKSTEVEQAKKSGPKGKRYALTDEGRKFYREKANDGGTDVSGLCFARKSLDKVVKWEGPMKFGDYQTASVTYTYKIDGLADWAKTPEFQAAFRRNAEAIKEAGKEVKRGVVLTNLGWDAK
jgi:DNA-binding PadR family transcriptional regulator